MGIIILIVFLAVVAAYYFLGTPLLDYIHKFTKEFTHTFPLSTFFLPYPAVRAGRSRPQGRR